MDEASSIEKYGTETCVECGEGFSRTHWRQTICSKECRIVRQARATIDWKDRNNRDKRSSIYCLYSAELGRFKIGYTNNPSARIAAYTTHTPTQLDEMFCVDGTRDEESSLLAFLKPYASAVAPGREWFEASDETEKIIDLWLALRNEGKQWAGFTEGKVA